MTSNKGLTNPRNTPEEEGEAMEQEFSPRDRIKDVKMDTRVTEVVTSKATTTNIVEVTKEGNEVENLTNFPPRGTPG